MRHWFLLLGFLSIHPALAAPGFQFTGALPRDADIQTELNGGFVYSTNEGCDTDGRSLVWANLETGDRIPLASCHKGPTPWEGRTAYRNAARCNDEYIFYMANAVRHDRWDLYLQSVRNPDKNYFVLAGVVEDRFHSETANGYSHPYNPRVGPNGEVYVEYFSTDHWSPPNSRTIVRTHQHTVRNLTNEGLLEESGQTCTYNNPDYDESFFWVLRDGKLLYWNMFFTDGKKRIDLAMPKDSKNRPLAELDNGWLLFERKIEGYLPRMWVLHPNAPEKQYPITAERKASGENVGPRFKLALKNNAVVYVDDEGSPGKSTLRWINPFKIQDKMILDSRPDAGRGCYADVRELKDGSIVYHGAFAPGYDIDLWKLNPFTPNKPTNLTKGAFQHFFPHFIVLESGKLVRQRVGSFHELTRFFEISFE